MYSWNNDPEEEIWRNGQFDSIEECIRNAEECGCSHGDTVYIGICEDLAIGGTDLSAVLEAVEEDMYSRAGEVFIKEKQKVLKSMSDTICLTKEEAVYFLEEIEQYRAIGTVEECRDARERQKPKKPIFVHPLQPNDGGDYMCPTCKTGTVFNVYGKKSNNCPYCGQKLDWSGIGV